MWFNEIMPLMLFVPLQHILGESPYSCRHSSSITLRGVDVVWYAYFSIIIFCDAVNKRELKVCRPFEPGA